MDFRDDDEVVETFLLEAQEHLNAIETGLVELERTHPEKDAALLQRIFRAAHSIKATSNLLELRKVERLTHRLENILQSLRKNECDAVPELVEVLFETLDMIRLLLTDFDAPSQVDVGDQLRALDTLLRGRRK